MKSLCRTRRRISHTRFIPVRCGSGPSISSRIHWLRHTLSGTLNVSTNAMVLETSTVFTMNHGPEIAGGTSKYVTITSSSKYVVVTCYNVNINYQSSLPHVENAVPFGLIMYADKSKISSFGTVKGYPVVVRCANLPVEIRNSKQIGGGTVVGWLPIVSSLPLWHRRVTNVASMDRLRKIPRKRGNLAI